ncbi:MAG: anti-sigma factor [Pseudolabrys sp.]|nr:anti-sigma factor [Pseudolabrys sp.]
MIDRELPVTEDDLHAYVDGELPAGRKEAVTAWLAAHPEQAALVAAWQAQGDAIRTRYGAVVNETLPIRLKLDQVLRNSRAGGRPWKAMAAAAAAAIFMIGGATGWMARGASASAPAPAPSVFERFTAEALEAYRLYVVEVRHPVEVPGSERKHMTQWLSKRLGYEQRIPDLQSIGLRLVGGRLLPGPTGAAAFYMYEGPSGERFTIYCARVEAPETALRFKDGERAAAFYWADDNAAYVVTGPANRERLETVTKAIYEQMEAGTKKS